MKSVKIKPSSRILIHMNDVLINTTIRAVADEGLLSDKEQRDAVLEALDYLESSNTSEVIGEFNNIYLILELLKK